MDLPNINSINLNDPTIDKNQPPIELRRKEQDRNIRMYKKLITCPFRLADFTMIEILGELASSDEIGDERLLLGSFAFASVFQSEKSSPDLIFELEKYLNLTRPSLSSLDETFQIRDLEWFKIAIIYGYLQVRVYPAEIYFTIFEILHRNCLTYTKHSYVAYKTLQIFLERTLKTRFWLDQDTHEIESKLEAIIFSNWDNCISEIVRRNVTQIFPTYLRIMSIRYDNFLPYIFDNCVQNLSWQNVTKYTILVEIFKYCKDVSLAVNSGLISCIFTSLTKNETRQPGTLLYSTILRKFKVNDWERLFSQDFFRITAKWESEKDVAAIDYLWEQWMKPTVRRFPNIFQYLWNHRSMENLQLSQTYLEKIGDELSFDLIYENTNIADVLSSRIIDISENVRLNAFSIISRMNNWKVFDQAKDPFILVKRFFYFNADASTIYMRKGIIENFKIFLINAIRLVTDNPLLRNHLHGFINWMHKFLLDCFEIGSSYQRKILGLSLYGIILNFTTDEFIDGVSAKTTKYKTTLEEAKALKMEMIGKHDWQFDNLESLFFLLKLVTNQMMDIRDKATTIIIRYFDPCIFTPEGKKDLSRIAMELCSSSKFHEIAGGAALLRILSKLEPSSDTLTTFLEKATTQLQQMRQDILKSAATGSSFFGALTVILEVGLSAGKKICSCSLIKLLNLVEEATTFFLSAFSTNDKDSEYSSSFKDMSIAIEGTIRNSEMFEETDNHVLSPAHQLVVSCIWMSLKVCCEVAAEIGCHREDEEIMIRAANVIVSVLLKCRHKGAIEAAGLALAKLTKVLCGKNYDRVIKCHLINVLNIDSTDNINLTRRGAGLTIMFHRIVSSDGRKNNPFLHLAISKLLDSLKSETWQLYDNSMRDSRWSRHLHFLKSLVADKGLQVQLVQYMEDICLLCFKYLQSSEWTVRNASLQLFGATVPRLVGQCSTKELDYGCGNTIDHFVTHYPNLAEEVIKQIEGYLAWMGLDNENSRSNCWIVPNLILLSKMSTGGCDLTDYSSKDYRLRAKRSFHELLSHPVFHVRGLAAKAYAAFVPLADIKDELTLMKIREINWYDNNGNHGLLMAQFYLQRKYRYEIKCTSETFVIRKHRINDETFASATKTQIKQADYCWRIEFYTLFGPPTVNPTIHNLSCFSINAMLLQCLIDCPVSFSIVKSLQDSTENNWERKDHRFIYSLSAVSEKSPLPGFPDFLRQVNAYNGQFLTWPAVKSFYMEHATTINHYQIFPEEFQINLSIETVLEYLIADVYRMLGNRSKTDIVIHQLWTIVDLLKNHIVSTIIKESLIRLSQFLKAPFERRMLQPRVQELYVIGQIIEIETKEITIQLWYTMFERLYRIMKRDKDNDTDEDVAKKKLYIEWLWHLVEKSFSDKQFSLYYSPVLQRSMEFLWVVATFLTDEDTRTRELVSDALRLFTRKVIGHPGNSICARATLHKMFSTVIISQVKKVALCSEIYKKIFKSVLLSTKMKHSGNLVKSPYEEDEALQRDYAEFFNILSYWYDVVNDRTIPEGNSDEVEMNQIDGIMQTKYTCKFLSITKSLICVWKNLNILMNTSTGEYIAKKYSCINEDLREWI